MWLIIFCIAVFVSFSVITGMVIDYWVSRYHEKKVDATNAILSCIMIIFLVGLSLCSACAHMKGLRDEIVAQEMRQQQCSTTETTKSQDNKVHHNDMV